MSLQAEEYRDHLRAVVQRAQLDLDEVVLPTNHHVKLNGLNFHYLDWGNEGRPTVVFLHGGGLNSHTWDLCCLALRDTYHCIALDQRGHGESQWSENADYSLAAQGQDLLAFFRHLGHDKVAAVGMSMGGMNALKFACDHSAMLSALVVVDVGPSTRVEGRTKILNFVRDNPDFPSLESAIDHAMAFNPRRNPAFLRNSLRQNMRQQPDGRWAWKYDHRRIMERGGADYIAAGQALWGCVARIACPTLVVRGAESDVFFEEDAVKLAQTLPNARHITIARAGHTVQGDNPKDLIVALRQFFGEAKI